MKEFCLTSLNKELSSILGFSIDSSINGFQISEKNEEEIFSTVIRKGRGFGFLTDKNKVFNFVFSYRSGFILTFSLQEYPNCCGKSILSGFKISNMIYVATETGSVRGVELTNTQINTIFEKMIIYCKELLSYMNYSSFSFIVSKQEQPSLFSACQDIGFVPSSIFVNRRYTEPIHVCNEYAISVE